MDRALCAALVSCLTACATPNTPASNTPAVEEVAPVKAETPYDAPSLDVAVRYESACHDRPAPAGWDHEDNGYGFEFDIMPLHAVRFGPKVAEMPRSGPRRTLGELYEGIADRAADLSACYGWVRGLDGLGAVETRAELTVDPFGLVHDVVVEGAGERLDLCVKEGLQQVRVPHRTPRITKAVITLAFKPSGLRHPRQAPPRPELKPVTLPQPAWSNHSPRRWITSP